MKQISLLLLFTVFSIPAFVPPPKAPKGALPTFGQIIREEEERQKKMPQFLEKLPGELRRVILSIISQYGGAVNVDALAKEILRLNATNKELRKQVNNIGNMLAIIKSLPKPAAIYLVEKLALMPVIQEHILEILQALPRSGAVYLSKVLKDTPGINRDDVKKWLKTIHLENGQELYDSVNATEPNIETITALLQNPNIDINMQTGSNGSTVLQSAIYNRNEQIVRLLLAAGAAVNTKNISGFTPLMIACCRDDIEIVRRLLEAGANVTTKTKIYTALVFTNKEDAKTQIKLTKLLVKAGANINEQRDDNGETLLISATREGRVEVVEALLALGADPTIKNKYKLTALDYVNAAINATNTSTRPRLPVFEKIAKLLKDALKAHQEKRK